MKYFTPLHFYRQDSNFPAEDNVLKIIHKVEPVIRFCCQYLQEEITLTNCVEISNLARFFSLNEVDDYVKNFILRNFGSFLRQEEFSRLSVDDVCDILSSDNIRKRFQIKKSVTQDYLSFALLSPNRGQTELELFLAGDKWLKYDKHNRKQHIHRVMRYEFWSILILDYIQ